MTHEVLACHPIGFEVEKASQRELVVDGQGYRMNLFQLLISKLGFHPAWATGEEVRVYSEGKRLDCSIPLTMKREEGGTIFASCPRFDKGKCGRFSGIECRPQNAHVVIVSGEENGK
jgi:hypothetical protein